MRILVIRPGALGDLLLTLPALSGLRAAFPQADLEVMGTMPWISLLPGRSAARSVCEFDRADVASMFQSAPLVSPGLQQYLHSFQLIVSYASGPGRPFAQNLARLACATVCSFDARWPATSDLHVTEHLQGPLRALGIPLCADPPRISLLAADRQAAAQWWEQHRVGDGPVLAIHPGSGSAGKSWPALRFVEVAKDIESGFGIAVLWVEGPAEGVVAAEVRRALGAAQPLVASNLPLPTLAGVLARCRAYLGNDSGVSHLAAAVGVPVVAVFGPTAPRTWAPRGPLVRTLAGTAPCAPCTPRERGRCQARRCLEAVSAQEVVDVLADMVGSNSGS